MQTNRQSIKKISLSLQQKAETLICNAGYLTFIIEDYPEIFDLLIVSSPKEKGLSLIHSKEQLREQMKGLNLQTPKIYDPSLHEMQLHARKLTGNHLESRYEHWTTS